MADDRMIELQRGLEYYYEAQKEFERRGLDIEQQVAFGFETGYQIGRAESLSEEALKLIRNPVTTPASNYKMREWA
jgi:hypothetical protein